ncbi:MAG: hypothetical protein AAB647_04375 [Patescibacteria group bacterium]
MNNTFTIQNQQKFELFLQIAHKLNSKHITPVLAGSLGLFRIIGDIRKANDIDGLLPDDMFVSRWQEIQQVLGSLGFMVDPDHIQEFNRGSDRISFLSYGDVQKLTSIDLSSSGNLIETTIMDTCFYELPLPIQRAIYAEGLKNKWRKARKEHEDNELIAAIDNYLS